MEQINKVAILGLGWQGKAALHDLVKNSEVPEIIVADADPATAQNLSRYPSDRVSWQQLDATDTPLLCELMGQVGLVIDALPATFALPAGKIAAKQGTNLVSSTYYIDPSEKDPEKLQATRNDLKKIDRDAKKKDVTILTEFGMDPGIDLVLAAKALQELDTVDEFFFYGSGIPDQTAAQNPLKYKFSWSPIGVMRGYMRPARIISGGSEIEISVEDIFNPEHIRTLEVLEIGGKLECYPDGDAVAYAEQLGIRGTVKEMARYTGRWPGLFGFWRTMARCGFLDEKPFRVGKTTISPIEFTSALLASQPQFLYRENEQDVILIRNDVRGTKEGRKKRIIYQLVDRRDLQTGFTAMQRTTGFTQGLGARLIISGQIEKRGLLSPVDLPFDPVATGLRQSGLYITRQEVP